MKHSYNLSPSPFISSFNISYPRSKLSKNHHETHLLSPIFSDQDHSFKLYTRIGRSKRGSLFASCVTRSINLSKLKIDPSLYEPCSYFTLAVNFWNVSRIALNENRSPFRLYDEITLFTSSREKSNALFRPINDAGSSLVVVKRVSIAAIKERAQTGREFQRSNDTGHRVSGASARKQPCLYRQLTSCRTLDRERKRGNGSTLGSWRANDRDRGLVTIYEISRKSPRRQWRLGAPPLWVER